MISELVQCELVKYEPGASSVLMISESEPSLGHLIRSWNGF